MTTVLVNLYREDEVCRQLGVMDDITARSAIRTTFRALEDEGVRVDGSLADAARNVGREARELRHALEALAQEAGCEPTADALLRAFRRQQERHLNDLIWISGEAGSEQADAESIIEAIRAGRGK